MEQHAERTFLSSPVADPEPFYARETLTFGQTYSRARDLAAQLHDRGVGLSTPVAIGGPNCTG